LAQRVFFWDKATRRLNQLGLSRGGKKRIEAAIAETLPKPTKRELARHKRDQRALWDGSFVSGMRDKLRAKRKSSMRHRSETARQ